MRATTIALAVIVFGTVGAGAAVLDQVSDTTVYGISATISDEYNRAQTFTVGISGTLQRLDLRIGRSEGYYMDDLIIDIRETVAGLPIEDDGNTLVTLVVSMGQVPVGADWVSFDLGAEAPIVTAGDHLAIVLRTENVYGDYFWRGDGSDSYVPGHLCFRRLQDENPVWEMSNPYHDAHFRTWIGGTVATESMSWTRIKSLMNR